MKSSSVRETIGAQFGRNVLDLRTEKGLSQEELAWRACLHRTQISLLETTPRLPRTLTVIALAAALGVSIDRLFAGVSFEPPAGSPGAFVVVPTGPAKEEDERRG